MFRCGVDHRPGKGKAVRPIPRYAVTRERKLFPAAKPPPQISEPIDNFGQRPDRERDEQAEQDQEPDRVKDGQQDAADRQPVLGNGCAPVGEGFRRGVDDQPAAGFYSMGRRCDAASQQEGERLRLDSDFAHRRRREDGACGNSDKAVNGIPGGIDTRQLVGNEFDAIEETGYCDHGGVGKYLHVRRQVDLAGDAQQSQGCAGGVEVKSASPGSSQRQRHQGGNFHPSRFVD